MGDFKENWRKHKEAGTLRRAHLSALYLTLRDAQYVVSFILIIALGVWLLEKFVLHETLHEWLMHILGNQ
jgi:hypothetical protein